MVHNEDFLKGVKRIRSDRNVYRQNADVTDKTVKGSERLEKIDETLKTVICHSKALGKLEIFYEYDDFR